MQNIDPIDALRATLPGAFPRREVHKLTGGIVAAQTIANAQARGEGPPAFKLNGKSCLERESFLEWLASRQRIGKRVAPVKA